MSLKSIVSFLLAALLVIGSVKAAEPRPDATVPINTEQDLTLEAAVALARERSALVDAFTSERSAALANAKSAGAQPDPVITLGLGNWPISGSSRFKLDEQLPTSVWIGISRRWVRKEKRSANTQRFESEADVASAQAALTLAEVSRNTAIAWLDRAITQKLAEVTMSRLEENQRLLASAEAAFRSGRADQSGVFEARLAIEQTRDRLDAIDRELEVSIHTLQRWIGDAARQPAGEIPTLRWQGTAADVTARQPELQLAQAKISLDEAKARVLETTQKPDWTVGVRYARRGSTFGDALSLQFSVPWQLNRDTVQTQRWAASRSKVQASQLQRQELIRQEVASVQTLATSLKLLNKRIARYQRRILPLAAQRADAALSAYSGGSGTLSGVLIARREQVNLRSKEIELLRQAARVWAKLKFLVVAESNTAQRDRQMQESKQ